MSIETTVFKKCPCCKYGWETRDQFLDDKTLIVNGYSADFEDLDLGLFFFTHQVENCGSTMTMHVKEFKDLYKGEIYSERKTLGADCPRFCTDKYQLARCEARCECAWVRILLILIKNRKL